MFVSIPRPIVLKLATKKISTGDDDDSDEDDDDDDDATIAAAAKMKPEVQQEQGHGAGVVGRCRLTVSKLVLKAPTVSALKT